MAINRPYYEPKARSGHCGALVESKWITYGGHLGTVGGYASPLTSVEIFDCTTGNWEQVKTTGTPPPGVYGAACAAIGPIIYHVGGSDHKRSYNTIHYLDTRTMIWSKLTPTNPDEAPIRKRGMSMTSFNNTLVTVGGFGHFPENSHPGVQYLQQKIKNYCYTNEVVCYDIERSKFDIILIEYKKFSMYAKSRIDRWGYRNMRLLLLVEHSSKTDCVSYRNSNIPRLFLRKRLISAGADRRHVCARQLNCLNTVHEWNNSFQLTNIQNHMIMISQLDVHVHASCTCIYTFVY